MTQDPKIVDKGQEKVKTGINDNNKNDDPTRPSIGSKLEQRGRGGKYFTFYNPIRNEARAQRQRRKDRESASKAVTWKKYTRYWKSSDQSCLYTCLLSGIIPLLATMGISFLCWGINENIVGVTPTYLYYPVISIGVVFLFSCFFLILGINLYKRRIFFIFLGFLVITLVLQVFVMIWINYRAEPYYLKSFLLDLLKSYHPMGKDDKTQLMDKIQTYFSCCGVTTYKDWFTTKTELKNKVVPRTCCIFPNPNTHKTRQCYETTNKSDDTMWALQTKGCLNPLKKFLANFEMKNWFYNGLGLFVVICSFIISLIYVFQTFNSFHKGINPEVYQMVCRLVNNLMDKYFANNDDKSSSSFSPIFRDYVHLELKRCKHLDELVNLLPTLADTLYYVKYSSPEGLANNILKGKPKLVSDFERGLRKIRDKKHKQKKVKEIETTEEKSYDYSQVPQNSVDDIQDFTYSSKYPDIDKIVVPHELKRRMKNVEIFLLDYKQYQLKSEKKQRKKNTKKAKRRHDEENENESKEVKFLRTYREASEDAMTQNLPNTLANYRKSTLGSSHVIEVMPLGRQRLLSQPNPLVGKPTTEVGIQVKRFTFDSTKNA